MQHWRLPSPIFHQGRLQTKMCSTNSALQSGSPKSWRNICNRPEKLAHFQPSVNATNFLGQHRHLVSIYKHCLSLQTSPPEGFTELYPTGAPWGFISSSADRGAKGTGTTWTVSKHRTCYITFNTCTILINQTCFICFFGYYMAIVPSVPHSHKQLKPAVACTDLKINVLYPSPPAVPITSVFPPMPHKLSYNY